jgi:curved DNA-binding protein CbpA
MVQDDYYAVLEVWPNASTDAIKEAYFKLAKVYHPDATARSGEDKGERDERFKKITEAYTVLCDPSKRREYDTLRSAKKEATARGRDHAEDKKNARRSFEEARVAMRHGRWDQAVELLKDAIQKDDQNPSYHSWYGFGLAKMGTSLHEARDSCKRALQMEFYNSEFHANLGYVYFKAGLRSTAMNSFREALKWDAENAMARKFLQRWGGDASRRPGQGGGLWDHIKAFLGLS